MGDTELTLGQPFAGRFVPETRLGSGGYGTVWRALDNETGRLCALKVSRSSVRAPAVMRRWEQEAEALGRIAHPHISSFVASGIVDEHFFIAVEYMPGHTLADEIEARAISRQHFGIFETLVWFDQLTDAIAHAHSHGVVHRDLKPHNLILPKPPSASLVKVIDFGLAKLTERTDIEGTTVGRLVGSILYLAPEQVMSKDVSKKSDIYSLGVLLFEILTRHHPWVVDREGRPALPENRSRDPKLNSVTPILDRIQSSARPAASPLRNELPAAIDVVLQRAMAIDPAERFESVRALFQATELALEPWVRTFVRAPAPEATLTRAAEGSKTTLIPRTEVNSTLRAQTPHTLIGDDRKTTLVSEHASPTGGVPGSGRRPARSFLAGIVAASALFIPILVGTIYLMKAPVAPTTVPQASDEHLKVQQVVASTPTTAVVRVSSDVAAATPTTPKRRRTRSAALEVTELEQAVLELKQRPTDRALLIRVRDLIKVESQSVPLGSDFEQCAITSAMANDVAGLAACAGRLRAFKASEQ